VSAGSVITLVLVLLLIAALAAAAGTVLYRRAVTRQRYGDEYTRLARDHGGRHAQAEFAARRRRVANLGIKPLTADRQARYARQWNSAQERFIDSPVQAAATAAALVTAVAADRGYEVDDAGQLLTDLSVDHGRLLDGYRRALATTQRDQTAATEELRQALLDYRALFRELLGSPDPGGVLAAGPDDGRSAASDAESSAARH
jgi:hypothetical protein